MEAIDYSIFGFAVFVFGGWLFSITLHLMAIIYGKWKLHRKPAVVPESDLPGVSIIKPLMGVDQNLYENLETFFNMDYPKYELLFCIREESDPAIMVVHSLMSKYPKVDATLFLGGKNIGINPKINNMILGYYASKYSLVVVSDSGLRMKSDTLLDMVSFMKDDVGLVHQMPYTCPREGFASVLETVYFGTHHAKIYLASNLVGINCSTGMSAMMRKSVLEEAGGLEAFSHYLAEDFFFAQAFLDRGWLTVISSQPAWQNSGSYSISSFQSRCCRWTKLRVAMMPLLRFFEPVSEVIVLGGMVAWAAYWIINISPLGFFLFHLILWFMLDYILIRIIQNGPLPFSKFDYMVAWIFREITSFYLIMRAQSSPYLNWRGKKFRIRCGGITEEIHRKQDV